MTAYIIFAEKTKDTVNTPSESKYYIDNDSEKDWAENARTFWDFKTEY